MAMLFELMEDAERRFGPRDASWFFGGINYWSGPNPCTATPRDGRKVAVICLDHDAINNPTLQRWQLAHEVIHLLSPPVPMEDTTILEEGLASYNQLHTSQAGYTGEGLFGDQRYQEAFDLVRPLVEAHPNGVRELRAERVKLSPLIPEWVVTHFPSVSSAAAQRLCQRFYG
jgi:hypothetical protein